MKKLFLFAALALFGFINANAQGESENNDGSPYGWSKGDVYLSGSVGIWSTKMGDSKDNQFNIMPQAGFLVTDHIAVGAQFGYMSSKSETNSNTTSETNTFMAGAYGKIWRLRSCLWRVKQTHALAHQCPQALGIQQAKR